MNTIVVIRDPRTLLGNRVRELRLGKELSQEKLAELAELHRNFVGAIERARRTSAW
jgi:transcriptional regulator with XRE-family HTH domain